MTRRLTQIAILRIRLGASWHDHPTACASTADRLACMARGIGITSVDTFVATHIVARLYRKILETGAGLGHNIRTAEEKAVDGSEVRIGERLDIRPLIETVGVGKLEKLVNSEDKIEENIPGLSICGTTAVIDKLSAVVTTVP